MTLNQFYLIRRGAASLFRASLAACSSNLNFNLSSTILSPGRQFNMSSKQICFDNDGDLLLRLFKPADEDNAHENNENTTPTDDPGDSLSTPASSTATVSVPLKNETKMLVSSKHLMVASPVFKAMFKPGFCREGELLKSCDIAEVDLPDDDPETFEILMSILHGRVRQVPEQINFKTITKLSVIADKYQILEPLEIYLRL